MCYIHLSMYTYEEKSKVKVKSYVTELTELELFK